MAFFIKPCTKLLIIAVISCLLLGCEQRPSYNFPHAKDNRWIIVNIWAAWCPPCRHEIPEFNQLAEEYKTQVVVYGSNADLLTGQALQDDIAKLAIQFEQLTGKYQQQFEPLEINTLPSTLLFSPQGKLVKQLQGEQTKAQLLAHINNLTTQ